MGDRFYMSQVQAIGHCPGKPKSRRSKRMAWTDERKQEAAELYEGMNPNPDNTIECVQEVAKQMGESVNGVRTILSKMGIYVKKTGGASPATAEGGATKTTRMSKEDAIESLKAAIEALGKEVDPSIVSKSRITGKAAVYFADIINSVK